MVSRPPYYFQSHPHLLTRFLCSRPPSPPSPPAPPPISPLISNLRLLRFHVHPLLHALLPRPARLFWQHVGGAGVHAIRALLRFHGRQGRPVERQKQSNGTRIGLISRSGTDTALLVIDPSCPLLGGSEISLHHLYIRPFQCVNANTLPRFLSVWHLQRAPLLLASAPHLIPCCSPFSSSAGLPALPASTLRSPLYQRIARARVNTLKEPLYLPLWASYPAWLGAFGVAWWRAAMQGSWEGSGISDLGEECIR